MTQSAATERASPLGICKFWLATVRIHSFHDPIGSYDTRDGAECSDAVEEEEEEEREEEEDEERGRPAVGEAGKVASRYIN